TGAVYGADAGASAVVVIPRGIELAEERRHPLDLVVLADLGGGSGQPGEGAKDATVGLVLPADITAAAPAVGAQRVEAPVIADPIGRVPLDRIAPERAERSPGRTRPRRRHDDRSDRGASVFAAQRLCLGQRLQQRRGLGWQDGFGRAGRGETNLRHAAMLG